MGGVRKAYWRIVGTRNWTFSCIKNLNNGLIEITSISYPKDEPQILSVDEIEVKETP